MLRATRVLASSALALALLVGGASPAAAHGVGGVTPSNYETRLLGVDREVDGLHLDVIELGDRLELRNGTGSTVVVLGYEDEPYLRLDPGGGVFENRRSPAVWANRDRQDAAPAPAAADSDAEPEWVRVSGSDRVRWHDHRVHWMGSSRPPVVERSPGAEHELLEWEVPVEVDGERVTYRGDLRWVPAPPVGPPLALAGLLLVAVVALGRTRSWPLVLGVATAVLVAAEAVHLLGLWSASSAGIGGRLLENLYSLVGIATGLLALGLLVRHRDDPSQATPAVLVAALIITIAGGLADIPALLRSQVPTTLDPQIARLGVAITLGVGVGTLVAAGGRLRRTQPAPPSPSSAEPASIGKS